MVDEDDIVLNFKNLSLKSSTASNTNTSETNKSIIKDNKQSVKSTHNIHQTVAVNYKDERRNKQLSSSIPYNNKFPPLNPTSRRIVSTFKSNKYSSLSCHKKSHSSIPIKAPSISNADKIYQQHDRWEKFGKSKNKNLTTSLKCSRNFSDCKANERDTSIQLLDLISDKDEDLEAISPEDAVVLGLNITLFPHQVHGLRFLKRRESLPGEFKGGLLCDDMGLGKTIQIISLILENRRAKEDLETKTNLIVCPVSLTNQWYNEILAKAPTLKVVIFHGPNRTKDHKELKRYDVVVTSYATICSEFHKIGPKSPLYALTWWRIILDEAHQIKNPKAQQSIACFNLKCSKRWCLTGTPIQNNLNELQSLFKFIRVSDFASDDVWREAITSQIKCNKIVSALTELQIELKPLMLRRTKVMLESTESLKLPPKRIHQEKIEFASFERLIYNNVKEIITVQMTEGLVKKTDKRKDADFDHKLKKSITKPKRVSYMSALVYLLRLRQICCSWTLLLEEPSDYEEDLKNESDSTTHTLDDSDTLTKLDSLFSKLSIDSGICTICQAKSEKFEGGQEICFSCRKQISPQKKGSESISSKFKEVLRILATDRERKTVIFSQFTSLLDSLKPILESEGHKPLSYTGRMSLKAREKTLTDAKTKESNVLLCSLKCSSVGLNLTFASRAIILDPYWNPAIQEQAIDRIYRIGQTKQVDVYEITIKKTVEDSILKLQERKRQLAGAVTTNRSMSSDEATAIALKQSELFELLREKH